MANTTIQERLGVKPEWVVESYLKTHNMMVTANQFKISTSTVHRILKRYGVDIDLQKVQGRSQVGKKHGKIHAWLLKNPKKKLPKDPHEIAELVGCTMDTVYSHLRRSKDRELTLPQALPDFRKMNGTLQLEDGRYITLSSISEYTIKADRRLGIFILNLKTRTGESGVSHLTPGSIQKKLKEKVWTTRS